MLKIDNLKRPQSETIILKELPNLSTLTLEFSMESSSPSEEQELAVEDLFDKIIPPQSLEDFTISGFFGRRFPNWMVSSPIEICVPILTKLVLNGINSCTQLPQLGLLSELRDLRMYYVTKVKKIGPEFFGTDINLTRFPFPKLEKLQISNFPELKEWSFGAQVEQNVSPRLKLLPCLRKLTISYCPLLKQLPKGLKYSTVKFLEISGSRSLKLDDNLPPEIEKLSLINCENLDKICCSPMLKTLYVDERYVEKWEALSCVEKLDSLQELSFTNFAIKSLPEWLLKLLQQRGLQNDSNDDFRLDLRCSNEIVQGCLKGGCNSNMVDHVSIYQEHY
ncbi:hypothetical protein M5K25_022123 [Dendrobium thyrsiflorum]|uniref:R13L1/DRL21-like LRR repeat region domain-containing protein n=1 Tax=Dendrobium thyrsiflorum TaxID=117978 RepID=A0ABD0UBV2_DENTH